MPSVAYLPLLPNPFLQTPMLCVGDTVKQRKRCSISDASHHDIPLLPEATRTLCVCVCAFNQEGQFWNNTMLKARRIKYRVHFQPRQQRVTFYDFSTLPERRLFFSSNCAVPPRQQRLSILLMLCASQDKPPSNHRFTKVQSYLIVLLDASSVHLLFRLFTTEVFKAQTSLHHQTTV